MDALKLTDLAAMPDLTPAEIEQLRTGLVPFPEAVTADMASILSLCQQGRLPHHDHHYNGENGSHSFVAWKTIVDAARKLDEPALLGGTVSSHECAGRLGTNLQPPWYAERAWGLTYAETQIFLNKLDTSFEQRFCLLDLFKRGARITSPGKEIGQFF